MKLTRLRIEKLPGIDRPFELGPHELASTLHVVFGANGSGKSSLVRALRAILWPETTPDERIEIEAAFESGAVKWFVRRDGSHITWQRDGVPSEKPALPPAELASSFLVTIEEVTQLDASDFEGRIRSALAGGVDFEELEEHWRWTDHGARDVAKRLREARSALEKCDQRLSALDQDLQGSAEVEARLVELRRLHEDGETVTRLIELDDAEGALVTLAAQSKAFPPGMDSMSGKEADRERELRGALTEAEDRLRAADADVERLETAAKVLALAEPLSEFELSTLEELIRTWSDLEDEQRSTRVELARTQDAERAAARRCPTGAKLDRLLDSATFPAASMDRLVRDGARIEAGRAALRSELGRLPVTEDGPALERITSALFALRGWLREPKASPGSAAPFPWLLVAAGCIGFVLMGSFVHPFYFAGAVGVVVLGLVTARARRPAASAHGAFQRQFEAQALGSIEWTHEAVERRSVELEDQAAVARERVRVDARRRELVKAIAELDEPWRELESIRAEVRAALGVDVLAPDFELRGFVEAVQALRTARDANGALDAAAKQLEREGELAAGAARSALERHGARVVPSLQSARGALADLRTRSRELREVLGDAIRAKSAVHLARGARDAARAGKLAFWAELGLEPDAVADLRARLARLPDWKRFKAEEQQRQVAIKSLRRKLGERVGELEGGREVLERRLRDSKEASALISELDKQIGGLHVLVRDARSRFDREAAAGLEAKHRAELEQHLRTAQACAMGGLLLSEVKAEYERRSQPELLERAGENMKRFTHGRYGVRGERDGGVRVIDHERRDRSLAIGELSTGTRAQLFLALRHAFASEATHGERVPFVLDDALATSDPDRIRAVGDALLAMTREGGWQVLYLTTDPTSAALLFGRDRGVVDVIDLAALRAGERGTLARDGLLEPERKSMPEPGGMSPEAYGELVGVPGIDPFAPVEALHPFYVLRDDLLALKCVLEARIASVGALGAVLDQRPDLLGSEARTRFRTWFAVAGATLAAWRVGRGTPVDRGVLAHPDSGVTGPFLDRLAELATEVHGDARELLSGIDAKDPRAARFRVANRQTLEQFLEASGHYDSNPPLEIEVAWVRVFTSEFSQWQPELPALRARFEWLWESLERAERERRA